MRWIWVSLLVVLTSLRVHAAESLPAPEVLRLIKNAEQVYVFPYTSSEHPKMNRKRLRLVDPAARDALKHILGDSRNWFVGFLDEFEALGVRRVGVLVRAGPNDLVLFFDTGTISATFRGRSYYGGLNEHKPMDALEKWQERYAHPELEGR